MGMSATEARNDRASSSVQPSFRRLRSGTGGWVSATGLRGEAAALDGLLERHRQDLAHEPRRGGPRRGLPDGPGAVRDPAPGVEQVRREVA